MLSQRRIWILIITIVACLPTQLVNGRAVATAYQSSRRALRTCKNPKIDWRGPLPSPSRSPVGDAEVDDRLRSRSPKIPDLDSRQSLIGYGRSLWQGFQRRLQSSADDVELCEGFEARWDGYDGVYPGLKPIWPELIPGISDDHPEEWKSFLFVPANENRFDPEGNAIHYENLFNVRQQAIVAVDNLSTRYGDDPERDTERATDHWSTVAMVGWVHTCDENDQLISNLKYILQDNIRNIKTEHAVSDILAMTPWTIDEGNDQTRQKILTPDDGDSFYLMLSTPGITGTVFMLWDFFNILGRKTIKEIGVVQWRSPLFPGTRCLTWVTLEPHHVFEVLETT